MQEIDFRFCVLRAKLSPFKLTTTNIVYVGYLLKFLRGDTGVATTADLLFIWKDIKNERSIYKKLSDLEKKGIIDIEKDENDQRRRYIKVLFDYTDVLIAIRN